VVSHPGREDIELTSVFHALSDPARLGIVCDLAASGNEMSCSALPVTMSKSTLSHHLKVLRDAGLTITRIEGTRRMVSLRVEDLDARFPGLIGRVVAVATGLPAPA
jgi:DNA-binding transcriptional ArsR family regulator